MDDDSLDYIYELKSYFDLIDESFFDKFQTSIKKYNEVLIDSDHLKAPIITHLELMEAMNKSEEIGEDNLNTILSRSVEFFYSLNESYGQMAANLLNDPSTSFKIGDPLRSASYKINLSNKMSDVTAVCHELSHMFSFSSRNSHRIKELFDSIDYSPLMVVLSEIPSFVNQLLVCDFIEQKYGNAIFKESTIYNLISLRMLDLDNLKTLSKILKRDNLDKDFPAILLIAPQMKSYDEQAAKGRFDVLMAGISHELGFMVACYIYQKVLEDPKNIKLYLGIDKVLSVTGKEQESLLFLEKIGFPFAKDGKLSIDDDGVKLLVDSTVMVLDKALGYNKESVSLSMEHPLIKQEYFDEINLEFDSITKRPLK